MSDNGEQEMLKEKHSGDEMEEEERRDHFIIRMLSIDEPAFDVRSLESRRQTIAFGKSTAIKLDTAKFRRLVSKPGA